MSWNTSTWNMYINIQIIIIIIIIIMSYILYIFQYALHSKLCGEQICFCKNCFKLPFVFWKNILVFIIFLSDGIGFELALHMWENMLEFVGFICWLVLYSSKSSICLKVVSTFLSDSDIFCNWIVSINSLYISFVRLYHLHIHSYFITK